MTKARDLANLISGGFTEADIPNLSASKITSGTIDNARLNLTGNTNSVNVFALNYNVLRVMSGMGGLTYSN